MNPIPLTILQLSQGPIPGATVGGSGGVAPSGVVVGVEVVVGIGVVLVVLVVTK